MKKIILPTAGMLAAILVLCPGAFADTPFFALDNGLTDVPSYGDQAALLKELGFAGICTRPNDSTPDLLAAFDL